MFLQEGTSPNDSKVLDRVKVHPSTPQHFLNQTEFFIAYEFHRNMFEQQQVGYIYFLNKVAASYLIAHSSIKD
ncbi:hypothetical protein HOO54_12070 [Bacillus sp. WMMC1349]|uniref:hypothetical protein n=1 Tax=Bacillus sp. WMMC1349 TaxID=2736254 RepID=UPI001556C97E|nr:hypothetical protein [Bacillus sp. WMMC1349]NPC92945.1 hypothetical protein [Bacillus sp. WMMC1349]